LNWSRRTLTFLLVLAAGCSGLADHPPGPSPGWQPLPAPSLSTSGNPYVVSVDAGDALHPALLGGVVIATPPSAGRFFSSQGTRSVAVWSAPSPSGPWSAARMDADPGRDGPNETIEYLARYGTQALAFGWRNSPTEGYPRPSAWDARGSGERAWQEIVEPREFFGGPNILGFGGAAEGPHGDFVVGTWTNPESRTVLSVWHSTDGRTWAQDASDPSFGGGAGEIPFAAGVADGARGVVVIATAELPTHADPLGQRGSLWYSPDGRRWSRVLGSQIADRWPRSVFSSVVATDTGWLVAGTTGAVKAPTVWSIGADAESIQATALPPGRSAASVTATVTAMATNQERVVVAGLESGRPVIWTATLGSTGVGHWLQVRAPPATGLQSVALSTGPHGTIVSLIGRDSTRVWTTAWH
jgi:hypothetical protein